MTGGNALSLKAHFLTSLPDILCLAATVTYLNLSFNNLQVSPQSTVSDSGRSNLPCQCDVIKMSFTLFVTSGWYYLYSFIPMTTHAG